MTLLMTPGLTSLHIGYLTIDNKNKNDFINDSWLNQYKSKEKGEFIDWYQFNYSFKTVIDGLSGNGKIIIPKSVEKVKMDEKDSTGI